MRSVGTSRADSDTEFISDSSVAIAARAAGLGKAGRLRHEVGWHQPSRQKLGSLINVVKKINCSDTDLRRKKKAK